MIHKALKVWSQSSLGTSLILELWLSYQLCLEFSEMGLSSHTLWKSKVSCKRNQVIVVLSNKDLIQQVFLSLLWWGCKGLSIPTPDRVVVIPDSVLIGTTACGGLGFPVHGLFSDGWFNSGFFDSLCYKISKVLPDMQYQGAPSCNRLSLLHPTSGLCSQWDSAIHA